MDQKSIPPEGVGIKVASRSRVLLHSIDIKRLIALWSEFAMYRKTRIKASWGNMF